MYENIYYFNGGVPFQPSSLLMPTIEAGRSTTLLNITLDSYRDYKKRIPESVAEGHFRKSLEKRRLLEKRAHRGR